MSDSLSNKELVAVGHQFAKTMSSDIPIIDMAKIVSRLAERLDCTTLALREATKQRDALAGENAGLNKFIDDECYVYGPHDVEPVDAALEKPKTPATDVYLTDVRAQGVEMFLSFCGEENSVFIEEKAYYRSLADAVDEFAAQLRKGVSA